MKNTKNNWKKEWKNFSLDEQMYQLRKEELSLKWANIKKEIIKKYKNLNKVHSLEIGSGRGNISLLLGKMGCKPSLLDYEKEVLQQAEKFFAHNKIQIEKSIILDLFNDKVNKNLSEKFDVVCSFGLLEHFKGKDRKRCFDIHFELAKPNGMVIIEVPNKLSIPYRIYMLIMKIFDQPIEEYPFTKKEIKKISFDQGITNFKICHGSFFGDFNNFLNPSRFLRIHLRLKLNKKILRQEKSSCLDFLSYNLIYIAEKKVENK